MAKSEDEIAATVEAGGNLPGGYVYNPAADPAVRKMTSDETRAAEQAVADEANAAKRRADLLKRANAQVVNDPTPTPV